MSTPVLKTLRADPDTMVDLAAFKPTLEGDALDVWNHFVDDTPYWWGKSDILTIERYCYLISVDRTVRKGMDTAKRESDHKRYSDGWSIMKSLSLELKNVEYSLGVTPQGRAALKLDHPDDQGEREGAEDAAEPMNPDDL